MKLLILVRHAKSSWDDPSLDDFDRPLGSRGKKDAPKMAKRLKKMKLDVDMAVSSPACRALSTARIFCKKIRGPKTIFLRKDIYEAGAGALIKVIRGFDRTCKCAMLFGHNPGLNGLASLLTGEIVENIPTCGVYAVQLSVRSWKNIGEKTGRRLFFIYPKDGGE